MSTPRLTSILFKAVPAFAISLALVAASANLHPETAIAQPNQSANSRAIASAKGSSFIPPKNSKRRPGAPTGPTARRTPGSCLNTTQTAFITLGPAETLDPAEILGLTASSRPEFVWYLPPSDIPYPIAFRLSVRNAKDDFDLVYSSPELTYASGFMKYQLPAEVADLSPDKEYRWQVIVQCDPDSPATWSWQALSFEVVSPSTTLLQSLGTATTDADRALAYGQAGFWYDAIAQVAQSDSPQAKAVRQRLLEDLANTAIENEQTKADILRIAETAN